jgi:hypothetical protein
MRLLLSVVLVAVSLVSACALRPYYREVLPPAGAQGQEEGGEVVLRVVEPDSGKPIAGARVLAGAGRARFSATSDGQGLVRVPVTSELRAENPLVEVVLPKGVQGYRLELVQEPASAPVQEPTSAPVQEPTSAPVQEPASAPVQEPASAPAQEPASAPAQAPGSTSGSQPQG